MTYAEEILVVEDSPTQAERLRHLLATKGFRVRVAADGQEALVALEERVPELVITDIVMPGMDGYELCKTIKSDEKLQDLPVILLTTLSEPHDIIKSLQCGADNFIRKPYDDEYLLTRIGNILTSRALRQSGRMGLEVYLAGDRHFITADRQQILDFLLSTYEETVQINDELSTQSQLLREANDELERGAAEVEAKNAELETRQTDLEQALRELGAEKQRAEELANVNRAVLDATADGIMLVDLAGNTLLSNAALVRIAAKLPATAEAHVSENVSALAPLAADPGEFRAFIDSLTAEPEREAHLDFALPSADLCLRLFGAPVRDGSGSLIGRIYVVRDITREREIDQLKSELVATVSHELRTPLTSVLGYAELLLSRDLDEASRNRHLATIASEARRLGDLVDDFLDLQRIEEGYFTLTPEPLDLGDVVRRQIELFSAQSKTHALALDLPDAPLPVLGERDPLSRVVANLLSNAIKYSPEGGAVEVAAGEQDGFVEVRVRDRGLGIPADKQDRIFTKFFRVDSSDTRHIGGTGLGLALCREIIQAHGGQIGFVSTEGDGSTFWFRLAANRGATARPVETRARLPV